MEDVEAIRKPIIVPPEEGRDYPMGQIRAIFKADTDETAGRYSVSEWWLEPRTRGPHVHQHQEDHVFYVIAGTLSVRLNEDWRNATKGSYIIIPGGTPHTFFSLSIQSRFAAESSRAAADGSVTFRFTKYWPVVVSTSGEDAR
jgi:mannose-6-phosphate isomerase-like protein (cupin superfamily)